MGGGEGSLRSTTKPLVCPIRGRTDGEESCGRSVQEERLVGAGRWRLVHICAQNLRGWQSAGVN